jgi:hypothetical protein
MQDTSDAGAGTHPHPFAAPFLFFPVHGLGRGERWPDENVLNARVEPLRRSA